MASPAISRIQAQAHRLLPPAGADDSLVQEALQRIVARHSSVRRWQMLRAALNLWFYQGRQWIQPNGNLKPSANDMHTFSFTEVYHGDNRDTPRPVQNEIAPAVDNEISMLLRKQFSPETAPTRDDPKYQDAARLAKDLLNHDLEQQDWIEARHANTFDIVTAGTGIMRILWDEPDGGVDAMVPTANGDSVICPECNLTLASGLVPATAMMTGVPGLTQGLLHHESSELLEGQPGSPASLRLRHCPVCEEKTELKGYTPSDDQIRDGVTDPFDRTLGDMMPKGKLLIENVNWWEYYPQNGGVGVEPRTAVMHAQRTPRSLDWIFDRWPELEGVVSPGDPREMLRYHPTFGDEVFATGRTYSATGDPDIYHNHALVTEVHCDPMPGREGYERGCSFVAIGPECDVVAMSDELAVEKVEPNGDIRLVPRVKYAAARFRRVPGQFWGRTFVDDMIGPQRRLNRLDAMVEDIREKFSPALYLPPEIEIMPRRDVGGSGRVFDIETGTTPFDIREALFPGQPMTGNQYFRERTALVEDLRRIGHLTDIESGQAPSGIKTTTGMMHLSEQGERQRAPREEEITSQYRTLWSAGLEQRWAFQTEPSTYEKQSTSGMRKHQSYEGTDLLGQSTVRVMPKQGPESAMMNRELTAEAHGMGLYDLSSQVARNKLLESMGLPTDINEGVSIQVRRAEYLWNDFMDTQLVPPIDTTLDDHGIFYAVLGKEWQSDESQEMLVEVGWVTPSRPMGPDGRPATETVMDEATGGLLIRPVTKPPILAAIAGWERRWQQAVQMDAMARAFYEGHPPQKWASLHAVGTAKAEAAGGQPPPPPPPTGQFLPDARETQVLIIWQRMGVPIENPWVKMRARIEAHRLYFEEEAMQAMAGQAQAEAPGAPQGTT